MGLNRDILNKAFPEIMKEYIFDKNFEYKIGIKMKKLTTFMLSGKESFKIGLDFFVKSKFAEVGRDEVFIGIVNSDGKLENYIIYYNFPLIKPIMAAIGEGIEKLNITNLPSVIQVKNALEQLIGKELKNVTASRNLSESFIDRLNTFNCDLTVNIYEMFHGIFPSIIKLCNNLEIHHIQLERFEMDQKINGIIYSNIKKLTLNDFLGKSLSNYDNFFNVTFPSVEYLILKGCWTPYQFSIGRIRYHLKFILSNFPNLKTLEFYCNIGKNNKQNRVKHTLSKFKPPAFKDFPSNIKIKMYFYAENFDIQEFDETTNIDGIIFNKKENKLEKIFEIRENFFIEFNYILPKPSNC